MDSFRHETAFAGVEPVSNAPEQSGDQVFENPDSRDGNATYLFLGGVGLIVFAIVNFFAALGAHAGQLSLHLTSTLPTIVAVALLARGFSLRNLPRRIVVGPSAMEITTKRSTRRYSWSEIGSAATANVLNSHKTCLRITDTAGKAIIRIDESFPDYQRLVKLVESYIDAKPDDTSIRITSRKAKRMGLVCFVIGCFLGTAAVVLALSTREEQRANELLPVKGVPGEGEIVRRFVARDGVTKRIEFRVAGSQVRNVEVDPALWDQLEHAKTVPVVYVPEEPDINRLQFGELKDFDFTGSPTGGYLLSALMGLVALLVLGVSPLAWMGYDLTFDEKQRSWKVKRYGRVIWASKKEALEQTQNPPNSPPLGARHDAEI
jgi:hypothetical protein